MRIKVTSIAVYPFDELSEDAKENAIQESWDINLFYEWWEFTLEDAAQAKLKIAEFELGRGAYCHGEFIEYAKDTAAAIIENHGEDCETHKTAMEFMRESAELSIVYPVKLDDDGFDDNESGRDAEQEELDDEFLKSILEDYRIMLQKEYEYLGSEDAIIETIKANEYEFTEDGKLA